MSILNITNLSHRYEDKVLFEGVDLSVNNFEHLGVVGFNGAGKSTFMKILTGQVLHDSGEVKWLNGISYGYLDQHADIDRSLTVMDYLKTTFSRLFELEARMNALYEGMAAMTDADEMERAAVKASNILDELTKADFYEIEARIKKVGSGLGLADIGWDAKIGTLSGGQRGKVMLSKLLLTDLDVLLLDEPTNFLDIEHIAWLTETLKRYKGTFILISHDTGFLDAVCEGIISLSNRQIKKFSGNYTAYMAQREMQDKQYGEDYIRQQREIKKLEEYVAKNKARAATAGMANSRQKRLDKIVEIAKPVTLSKPEFRFPYILISAREILTVQDLLIGYEGRAILPEINFSVLNGDRLWIRGTNGIGKTTLLKTVMGMIPKIGGSFEFNINAKPGYMEQDLIFTDIRMNAVSYMSDVFPKLSKQAIRTMLGGVGIKQELSTKAVEFLSGGEQMRVKLCAQMNRPSNILILDEPTNHLDVKAKEALLEALQKYEGNIILVSHEIPFAKALCNKVFDVK